MGTYFNPESESFAGDKRSKIYVDKTGLLSHLNEVLGTSSRCIAVSHARRFGKSHAAGMIDAYYSLGSDSAYLFDDTKIAQDADYKKFLNKYNVIHLDIASVWDFHEEDLVEEIHKRLREDFNDVYGDSLDCENDLYLIINKIYNITKIPFVIIIDEWDCVIRNSSKNELIHKYLQFLHTLFKSEESKSFLALAYITGIMPIKKIKNESALNNFREYTMLDSYPITEYYGFTEDEIKALCGEYSMDFDTMKAWYNGYQIDEEHMYNPNSVTEALQRRKYNSYWNNTSSFETINTYIGMNYEGLKDDIINMLAGGRVCVDTDTFQNDLSIINSKDDAITALIHLGYLGYNTDENSAYMPNYEVKTAYKAALKTGGFKEVAQSISRCDELLTATIQMDEEKVAQILEIAHETYTSVLKYNDENSLSCTITMAYFTAPAYYNIVREMPSGKGFADLIFIPRKNAGSRPAMIVELKWDRNADTTLKQIEEKRYTGSLVSFSDKVLLVGINYDKDSKKHECVIREMYFQVVTVK